MPGLTEDELEPTTLASPEDRTTSDTEPPADDAGGSAFEESPDPLTYGLEDDEDADPSEAAAPASDERPRGPDGKFVKAEPGEVAPPTEGDGVTGAASGAVPEAAGALPPADPPVPWVANLYGEDAQPIPGALYKAGHGVFVPERELGTLTALVARGRKYETFKQERQQWAQEREALVAPVQAEARAVAEVLATVLNPDWITTAALDPQRAMQDIALTLREKQLELREQFRVPPSSVATTAPQGSEVDPYDASATIRAEVTDLLSQPAYHGLFSAQDVQAMERRLSTLHPFVQDESGAWYLDRQVVREFVDTAADAPRRLAAERKSQQAHAAAQQAAKRNQQVAATTTPPKPTAAKPKPSAPPAFDGDPWENPALSFEERKAAWEKAHGA